MIVETMTDSDIVQQMDLDMPEVKKKAADKLVVIGFRRQIIKATTFPISASPFVVATSLRNRWLVILRARSRKEKNRPTLDHSTFVCLATFQEGVYAFVYSSLFTPGKEHKNVGLSIFKPHFFARYKLRYELNETGIDLIGRYFVRNNSLYRDFQLPYTDEAPMIGRKVYGTSEQGIALGEVKSDTAILFRTYISYDMMYDGQIPEFTRSEILRRQAIRNYMPEHMRLH